MTREEVQYNYSAWKGQLDAGLISAEQFHAAVSQLQASDASGAIWTIDPRSGGWLMWDGAAWTPAAAPAVAAPVSYPAQGQAALGAQPQKSPWSQRIWDVVSVAGSSAMSAAWYWYSSLDPYTKPDYKTCIAMVLLPILLIVFREKIDGWLQPLQPFRAQIPRMVLLGVGAATPLLISNFLYASGSANYPYMLKTYLISTILSYVILRQPPRAPAHVTTGRMGGTI